MKLAIAAILLVAITMKVAYLILAHHQPQHLARLVDALKADWSSIFIHIDAKADISKFRSLIPENDKIVFLKGNQRVKVYWGGFSQILATLNLLQKAASFRDDLTRYCLLSGSDFPIKSQEQIKAEFSTQKEFIRIDRKLSNSNQHRQSRNIKFFYFRDRPTIQGNWLSGFLPRPRYKGLTIYHGAQWWSLTRECIDYLFSFLDQNADYLRFHRYANCSDEMFFHSIVKQSPFCEHITHDFETLDTSSNLLNSKVHGCHYIEWAEGSKSPKILTTADLSSIITPEALFARKFDQTMSQELVEQLQGNVLTSKM